MRWTRFEQTLRPMRIQSAVLLYPGCIFFEIALAVDLLAESHDVRYFTPNGEHHTASNGAVLVPHGSYSSLAASSVACVLVPGGNPDSIVTGGLATECLASARERGAIMAGICAGNLVLASLVCFEAGAPPTSTRLSTRLRR